MKDKLFSVIIPVYQVKSHLVNCIESVVNQTYKNIEIILVDDGSSDGSEKLCESYSEKYNNIFTIHQENKGVSSARNRGMDYADGEYVLFIDSDDYIDLTYLENAAKVVENNNIDMYLCGYQNVNKNGKVKEKKYFPAVKDKVWNYNEINSIVLKLFNSTTLHAIGTKIYKNSILKREQIRFEEKWKYYEDVYFCLKYLKCCNSIYIQNKIMYYYKRDVSNSLSKQKINIKYENINKTCSLLAQLMNLDNKNNRKLFYQLYLSHIGICLDSRIAVEGRYTINIHKLYKIISKDLIFNNAIKYLKNKNVEYFLLRKKCFFGAYLVHNYLICYFKDDTFINL